MTPAIAKGCVMSEKHEANNNGNFLEKFHFTKMFNGFKTARQPGMMALALLAVIDVCILGWLLDACTPADSRVVTSSAPQKNVSEIDLYVSLKIEGSTDGFELVRDTLRKGNEENLRLILRSDAINKSIPEADKLIADGQAVSLINDTYKSKLDKAIDILEKYYSDRKTGIEDERSKSVSKAKEPKAIDAIQEKANLKLTDLEEACDGVRSALFGVETTAVSQNNWIAKVIFTDEVLKKKEMINDQKTVRQIIGLAENNQAAQAAKGRGIFAAFLEHKINYVHGAAVSLATMDIPAAKTNLSKLMALGSWMMTQHKIFALLLILGALAIYAVAGGAICRIAAMQIALDERVGPTAALRFSYGKFASFFSAPLLPLAIIAVFTFLIWAPSLIIGNIPGLGETLCALLTPLAILAGAAIALISVLFIAGFSLMFPAIAVEGSDGFDAMSRSFTYVHKHPWRMGLYALLATVYGAICYLFVRLFIFLTLKSVHCSAQAGIDAGADQIEAIWPSPTWANLQPEVNWLTLGTGSTLAAGIIWVFVALVSAMLLAYAVSFYFTTCTQIYYILRNLVDGTDIEDVFVDQHIEELIEDEPENPPTDSCETPSCSCNDQPKPTVADETKPTEEEDNGPIKLVGDEDDDQPKEEENKND